MMVVVVVVVVGVGVEVVVVVVVVRVDVGMCQPGDRCMVVPSLSADEAKKEFSDVEVVSVPSGKAYLRFTSNY